MYLPGLLQFVNVCTALKNLMDADHSSPGTTLNLPGPKTYTHTEFLDVLRSFTLKEPSRLEISLPKGLLQTAADVTNRALWWPFMDRDKIERAYINDRNDGDIRRAKDGLSAKDSWAVCGFEENELDTLEDHAIKYLRMHRAPYVFIFFI